MEISKMLMRLSLDGYLTRLENSLRSHVRLMLHKLYLNRQQNDRIGRSQLRVMFLMKGLTGI